MSDGRLQYVEEMLDGIERAPDAIAGLYRGENLGKRLIRLHVAGAASNPVIRTVSTLTEQLLRTVAMALPA